MTQPTPDPITGDGTANRSADDEADPSCRIGRGGVRAERMNHNRATAGASPGAHHGRELLVRPDAGCRGQHSEGPGGDQAASRWRPFRRRLDSTARPARVRMRRRNPCVLCRRRLLG
jgi:hypothetical protein